MGGLSDGTFPKSTSSIYRKIGTLPDIYKTSFDLDDIQKDSLDFAGYI